MAAATGLYGLASQPAPPDPGLAEGLIGLLLVAAVGLTTALRVGSGASVWLAGTPRLEALGSACLLYLAWLPLLLGLGADNDPAQLIRDLIPLLYLFLPALLAARLARGDNPAAAAEAEAARRWLSAALALAGVAFAGRWWQQHGWALGAIGHLALSDGPSYLANSLTVLFAAIHLPLAAAERLLGHRPRSWRRRLADLALAVLLAAGGALCLAALAGAVHRLSLVLAGLAFALYLLRRPTLLLLLPLALLIGLSLPGGLMTGTVDQVLEKSRLVGVNQRLDEAASVLARLSESPLTALFGCGWGASFSNPAVAGWHVGYTHALATYALLKTGIVGALVLGLWLAALAPSWWRLARRHGRLTLALTPCLITALGAQTSYKYLCFGLILTLMVVAGRPVPATTAENR